MNSIIRTIRRWANSVLNTRQWLGLRVRPPLLYRCMLIVLILSLGVCLFAVSLAWAAEFRAAGDLNVPDGEVGIGTTAPSVELEVAGDGKFSGDLDVDGNDIDIGDAGGFSGIKFAPATTTLDFYIDGVKVSYISADGTYTDNVP